MKKTKFGICLIGVILLIILLPTLSLGMEPSLESTKETQVAGSELSLEEAVQRALAVSNDLTLADYAIERNEELRGKAAEAVTFTPVDNTASDEASRVFIKLVQSDISLQNTKKSKEIKKDALINSVQEKYINVLLNQEKVIVAEKALEVADFERWSARVRYQWGKMDLNSKVEAEKNYLIKEAALQESRANLEDSYIKLNDLVGLPSQDRPRLYYAPEFSPLSIQNLEAEVQRRLEIDPTLWQAQNDVAISKLELSLYNYNGTETYRVKQIDLASTELEVVNTKDQARQKVYDLYKSISLLEEQYKTKEQDLQLAEQNLQANQVKFRLGMINKADVLAAEYKAENARLSLKTALYEHELLKRTFEKPWIA